MRKWFSRRAVLLLLAVVSVVVTGITESFASGGSSQLPLSPPGEERDVVTASAYTPPAGPLLSDSQLATIAYREAALANEPSPASVRAVDTTLKSAEEIQPNVVMPASSTPSVVAMEGSAVVVIVMHGSFTLTNARVPLGSPPPTGSVLTIVVDAHTGQLETRAVDNEEPPHISALGSTRELEVGGNATS